MTVDRLDAAHPGLRLVKSDGSGHSAGGVSQPGLVRVAFAARTSTEDQQDPELSIPRQLRTSQGALPDTMVITAYFYDIESGRKDLEARGHGRAHERFRIPVPRDGGIQDLLEEARRPDRRFDVVICESIDRISRRTYYGTKIEHELEQAGVILLAADEPIILSGNRATQVLTRRVKQGVAEWYVLDMLEKSWGGFKEHTYQGYNIGKPPYGYLAAKAARPLRMPSTDRRGGPSRSKTKLVPDPVRAPVVRQIYTWRVDEHLGYKAIATRLNQDLDRYPPPEPPDPQRAAGRWTASSVRDLARNPKYTGYMVWNRRAMRSRHGKVNPTSDWVWSTTANHEPLVGIDTYLAAFSISARRERSRSEAGANTAHPQTTRSYPLRAYLFCGTDECGRRMFGKTRHGIAYYACQPARQSPDGHPGSLWVRERHLLDGIHHFFAHHIFGTHRRTLLADALRNIDTDAEHDRRDRITALQRAIADLDTRKKRLIRSLELADDEDGELSRDVKTRLAELRAERATKHDELTELESQPVAVPSPHLLDELPVGTHQLARLPEPTLRRLFEAFRLEIHYDRHTNTTRCRVTLTAETQPAIHAVTGTETVKPLDRVAGQQRLTTVPICGVPRQGTPQMGTAGNSLLRVNGWWSKRPSSSASAHLLMQSPRSASNLSKGGGEAPDEPLTRSNRAAKHHVTRTARWSWRYRASRRVHQARRHDHLCPDRVADVPVLLRKRVSLGRRLGVPPWVAPLVGPAVDLSVVGLLIAVRYLTACGCSRRDLRPARLLLLLCGAATLALNIAEPVVEGEYGRAAFDAVGPLLLLGWSEVGPGLLRLINHARTLDPSSITPTAAAPTVGTLRVDARQRAHQMTGLPRAQRRLLRSATQEDNGEDAGLWARARDIDLAHRPRHGRPVSADTLRVELHVGSTRARSLIRQLRTPTIRDATALKDSL